MKPEAPPPDGRLDKIRAQLERHLKHLVARQQEIGEDIEKTRAALEALGPDARPAPRGALTRAIRAAIARREGEFTSAEICAEIGNNSPTAWWIISRLKHRGEIEITLPKAGSRGAKYRRTDRWNLPSPSPDDAPPPPGT